MSPWMQNARVAPFVQDHPGSKRGCFETTRRNLIEPDPALMLRKKTCLNILEYSVWMIGDVGVYGGLDVPGKIKNAGPAFRTQHGSTRAYKSHPVASVNAIFFLIRQVANQPAAVYVTQKSWHDLPFLCAKLPKPVWNLPRTVANVQVAIDDWRYVSTEQSLRHISRKTSHFCQCRQFRGRVDFFDFLRRHTSEKDVNAHSAHLLLQGVDLPILILNEQYFCPFESPDQVLRIRAKIVIGNCIDRVVDDQNIKPRQVESRWKTI